MNCAPNLQRFQVVVSGLVEATQDGVAPANSVKGRRGLLIISYTAPEICSMLKFFNLPIRDVDVAPWLRLRPTDRQRNAIDSLNLQFLCFGHQVVRLKS